MTRWLKLSCRHNELNLDVILSAGQSFRWHETNPREWTGVLCGRVYTLSQNNTDLLYKVFRKGFGIPKANFERYSKQVPVTSTSKPACGQSKSGKQKQHVECSKCKNSARSNFDQGASKMCNVEDKSEGISPEALSMSTVEADSESSKRDIEILHNYFQLDVSLKELYSQWESRDGHFKHVAQKYMGIRQLRQDPVENLFSFICSSNNNIARISSMVGKLCESYGEKIAVVDGHMYYTFPTIEALAGPDVEETLRKLGFGYRAKYISQTARYIHTEHCEQWLYDLRNKPYQEARCELIKMCGVGPKVADCVCLMSLDKPGSVPVDTHVFQVAQREYSHNPAIARHKAVKSVTDKVYTDIGDFFRKLWGDYAGWAQSVLFSAELPRFQDAKETAKSKVKRKSTIKDETVSGKTQKKK